MAVTNPSGISTHAPAGGATRPKPLPSFLSYISTHAPAGGATRAGQAGEKLWCEFLLTPLREGRQQQQRLHLSCARISTHAPAGGATQSALPAAPILADFYSRPCGRGDRRDQAEARPRADFYSRPCGRGDETGGRNQQPGNQISTHAPAGGATTIGQQREILCCYFYSRPCGRGDTRVGVGETGCAFISTHAPAGGATRVVVIRSQLAHISTHAPAGGATSPQATCTLELTQYFYSRPCGRGDSNFPQVRHEVLRQIAER